MQLHLIVTGQHAPLSAPLHFINYLCFLPSFQPSLLWRLVITQEKTHKRRVGRSVFLISQFGITDHLPKFFFDLVHRFPANYKIPVLLGGKWNLVCWFSCHLYTEIVSLMSPHNQYFDVFSSSVYCFAHVDCPHPKVKSSSPSDGVKSGHRCLRLCQLQLTVEKAQQGKLHLHHLLLKCSFSVEVPPLKLTSLCLLYCST